MAWKLSSEAGNAPAVRLLVRLYWSRPRLTTHAADAVQRAGATAVSLLPALSPDISNVAESGLVPRTRRMFAARLFTPTAGVDRRKVRVARRTRVHMGDLDTVGKGHRLLEDVGAADHDDLIHAAAKCITPRGGQRRIETAGDHDARRRK